MYFKNKIIDKSLIEEDQVYFMIQIGFETLAKKRTTNRLKELCLNLVLLILKLGKLINNQSLD